jgi:hypothetical protein
LARKSSRAAVVGAAHWSTSVRVTPKNSAVRLQHGGLHERNYWVHRGCCLRTKLSVSCQFPIRIS